MCLFRYVGVSLSFALFCTSGHGVHKKEERISKCKLNIIVQFSKFCIFANFLFLAVYKQSKTISIFYFDKMQFFLLFLLTFQKQKIDIRIVGNGPYSSIGKFNLIKKRNITKDQSQQRSILCLLARHGEKIGSPTCCFMVSVFSFSRD